MEHLPIQIDRHPQLFIDNHLIHFVQDVTRRMHRPVKVQRPLISADRPWEHIVFLNCGTWTVLYDPVDRNFKCFYMDVDWSVWHERKFMDTCLLLAISEDGINWQKPAFGVRKVDGDDTNIVFGRDENGSVYVPTVFLDSFETDPQKRFKVIYRRHLPASVRTRQRYGKERICFEMATSPDGIHWTPIEENPITPSTMSGDVNLAHRDPITGKIVLMARPQSASTWVPDHPDDHSFFPPYDPAEPFGFINKRNVWRSDSQDGIQWDEARCVLRPDELDNLDDGLYGLAHWRVGPLCLGLLNLIHGVDDTTDIELVYSRDAGETWVRPYRQMPYVPRGGAESWDRFVLFCCSAPVNFGKETFVFYSGSSNHHDWWMHEDVGPDVPEKCNLDMVSFNLGVARMRRNGYVSLDTGLLEGTLATKPFEPCGDKLVINAVCREGGCVAVEVQDLYGRTWPGFSREDCDVFAGDDTQHVVTWRGQGDLSQSGKYLKLQFSMKNASLYSLALG